MITYLRNMWYFLRGYYVVMYLYSMLFNISAFTLFNRYVCVFIIRLIIMFFGTRAVIVGDINKVYMKSYIDENF